MPCDPIDYYLKKFLLFLRKEILHLEVNEI